MDKATITSILQDKISSSGREITVVAQEYAYYLLLNHYKEFKPVLKLNSPTEYLEEYKKLIEKIGSSMGHYLLGNVYQKLGYIDEAEEFLLLSQAIELSQQGKEERVSNAIIANHNSREQGEIEDSTVPDSFDVRFAKAVYHNPLFNHQQVNTILKIVYQYGGIAATNQLISLALNKELYMQLVYDIETDGINLAIIKWLSIDSNLMISNEGNIHSSLYKNIKFNLKNQDEYSSDILPALVNENTKRDFSYDQSVSHSLVIASFTTKEMIEIAPTLKYFVKEILGVHNLIPKDLQEIKLPEIINNNYFWITIHYAAGTLGALSLKTSDIGIVMQLGVPAVSTFTYSTKLIAYDVLVKQRQLVIQNAQDESISNTAEFIDKCGFDMAMQTMLSFMSSGLNKIMFGTPLTIIAYDTILGAAVGGMQCFATYQQTEHKEQIFKINIENTVPYIVDSIVLSISIKNLNINNNNLAITMLSIKQSLTAISLVVVSDQISKLLLHENKETINYIESLYLDPVIDYISGGAANIFSNSYLYFAGNKEDSYEF